MSDLQASITGLRLDVVMPDFAGAIKGLKTLTSIDDKLDTALANGKIAADRQANDFRAKLAWVNEYAADHRALLADIQHLVAKPFDDFKLAVETRVAEHRRREEARQESERERIRREERERLEREQAAANAAAERARVEIENRQRQEEDARLESMGDQRAADAMASQELTPAPVAQPAPKVVATAAPAVSHRTRTVKLGDINASIAPLSVTADGLASLGFQPVGTERAAKLYAESDLPAIYRGLIRVINAAAESAMKAAA